MISNVKIIFRQLCLTHVTHVRHTPPHSKMFNLMAARTVKLQQRVDYIFNLRQYNHYLQS